MFGTKPGWPDLTFLATLEAGRLLMLHHKKPATVNKALYVFMLTIPQVTIILT